MNQERLKKAITLDTITNETTQILGDAQEVRTGTGS